MNINDVLNNINYDEETPEFGEPDVADKNEEEREIKKESNNKTLGENSNSDIAFEQLKKDENNFAVDSIVPEKDKELEKTKEIEETEELNTIEKLIQKVNEIGIPIYTDNYFVKKAEIELDKILNKKSENRPKKY